MNEFLELGARLLFLLWRDVDVDFKAKYKLKIWDMYLANVRIASLQSQDLGVFVERLTHSMNIGTGRNRTLRAGVLEILRDGNARLVLQAIRREPSTAIRYARELNDDLRASYEDED